MLVVRVEAGDTASIVAVLCWWYVWKLEIQPVLLQYWVCWWYVWKLEIQPVLLQF